MAFSVTERRMYSEEYINYGFTSILADGIEKPLCVLCFKVLGNDFIGPSNLKHMYRPSIHIMLRKTPISSGATKVV
ncbi:SCAN domain-containing protein 3 [Portunus trituberculatus]|uniref:SCAN domain-containing protein 3 n=1 Tax=Portunus trituberculatus TaxID=210409 RepID=A0A5B7HVX3_PORTR|nr:SCAN domain-containing protein 3 [Portunus trituberculatus]